MATTAAEAAALDALKRGGAAAIESLFEKHTTAELRAVERQLRAGIEGKREELRQMVGERYRDLIEAADTIAEMRVSAERLLEAVRGLQQRRSRGRAAGPAASSQPKAGRELYLLCCHLRGLLQLDSSGTHYSPILACFPILARQVAAASYFRSTILQESKSLLKCRTVSDQTVAEALCSAILLEDSSPRQALADFLLARKSAIQQLLNQPHHDTGIKAQVCSLVELLVTTLYQAHALFYNLPEGTPSDPSLPCGLLFLTLETITSQHSAGLSMLKEETKLSSSFKYLPPSVTEFQPALRTLAHPISEDCLRDTLQKWISMCNEDIKSGITDLLVYVKSLKGLARIRDAVWELLTSESMSQNWETVCHRLLDKPISFWEDLLHQLFLDRLQTLTKEGFDDISNSSRELLLLTVQELEAKFDSSNHSKHILFECNMASFLWSENPNDLPSDAAWISVANRSQFTKSGLSMKAQAYSPSIQGFCSALDSKLKARLEDLLSYLPSSSTSSEDLSYGHSKNSAFNRFADASIVEELLCSHCICCSDNLLGCVREKLHHAQKVLQGCTDSLHNPQINTVLFMARLCRSLGELCPHLKQCILGKSGCPENTTRELWSLKKAGKGRTEEMNPIQAKWQGLKEQLLQDSLSAYRIWSAAAAKVLVQNFTQSLLKEEAEAILATATNWEESEIEEETESSQHSGTDYHIFLIYDSLNRNFRKLVWLKVDQVNILKKCSLCCNVLEKWKSWRIEKQIDVLESYIDPFDLDVFTPHLNSNLNHLVQRTSVLFGLLTGTENQYTSRSSALTSQKLHNILPLTSSQIRFGLLPLSTSSSRKAKPVLRNSEHETEALTASLMRAEEMLRPGSLFRQLAAEEEDTTAPSLFKLGWLSSMTK
ncbi:hypothetical protein Chor_012252 [Crotalus horridus]